MLRDARFAGSVSHEGGGVARVSIERLVTSTAARACFSGLLHCVTQQDENNPHLGVQNRTWVLFCGGF